jgi:hypothetical protein
LRARPGSSSSLRSKTNWSNRTVLICCLPGAQGHPVQHDETGTVVVPKQYRPFSRVGDRLGGVPLVVEEDAGHLTGAGPVCDEQSKAGRRMNELSFDHQAGDEVGLDCSSALGELAIAERNELGRDNAHSCHQEDTKYRDRAEQRHWTVPCRHHHHEFGFHIEPIGRVERCAYPRERKNNQEDLGKHKQRELAEDRDSLST